MSIDGPVFLAPLYGQGLFIYLFAYLWFINESIVG